MWIMVSIFVLPFVRFPFHLLQQVISATASGFDGNVAAKWDFPGLSLKRRDRSLPDRGVYCRLLSISVASKSRTSFSLSWTSVLRSGAPMQRKRPITAILKS